MVAVCLSRLVHRFESGRERHLINNLRVHGEAELLRRAVFGRFPAYPPMDLSRSSRATKDRNRDGCVQQPRSTDRPTAGGGPKVRDRRTLRSIGIPPYRSSQGVRSLKGVDASVAAESSADLSHALLKDQRRAEFVFDSSGGGGRRIRRTGLQLSTFSPMHSNRYGG